jgi:predicted HAD superfamily Cof-like phosphohydrolase
MNQINLKPFFEMVAEFSKNLPKEPALDIELRKRLIREEWTETKAETDNTTALKSVLVKEICDLIYVTTGGLLDFGYGTSIASLSIAGQKSTTLIIKDIGNSVDCFTASPDTMYLFKAFNNSFYLALKFVTYEELLQAFTLVHESNMSKFKGAKYDKYGKISKSKSYKKPDLTFLDVTESIENDVK